MGFVKRSNLPLCIDLLDRDLNDVALVPVLASSKLALYGSQAGRQRLRKQKVELIEPGVNRLRPGKLHSCIPTCNLTTNVRRKGRIAIRVAETRTIKTQVDGKATCEIDGHRSALTSKPGQAKHGHGFLGCIGANSHRGGCGDSLPILGYSEKACGKDIYDGRVCAFRQRRRSIINRKALPGQIECFGGTTKLTWVGDT